MANEAKATLILQLKDLATKKLGKFGNSMKSLGSKMEKSKFLFAGAFAGITAGIGMSLKAFAEEELAIAGLVKALGNHGNASTEAIADLRAYASEIQTITNYSDTQVIALQAQLATFGMAGDELKTVTKATLDLSVAQGVDLKAAALLMGKAFAGETSTLSRYGIIVDQNQTKAEKFTQALKIINTQMGGRAAAERQTFIGQMTSLKNIFGDIAQEIGSIFAPMIGKAADIIGKLVIGFQTLSPKVKVFIAVAAGAALAVSGLVTGIVGITFIAPAVAAAFGVMFSPVFLGIGAIVAVTAAFIIFKEQIKAVGEVGMAVASGLKNSWSGLMEAFSLMLKGKFSEAWEAAKSSAADGVIAVGEGIKSITDIAITEGEKQFDALQSLVSRKIQIRNQDTKSEKKERKVTLKDIDAFHAELYKKDQAQKKLMLNLEKLDADNMAKLDTKIKADQATREQAAASAKMAIMSQLQFFAANTGKAGLYLAKGLAVTEAIINTAVGVTSALKLGAAGIPLAAVIAALGAAQVGIISAQAVNMAEGGIVSPTSTGTIARIGEAGSREAIIPLDSPEGQDNIQEALGGSGGGVTINVNAGVLVADDESIEKLAKEIDRKLFDLKSNKETISI